MTIRFRAATIADARMLLDWRNDASTRAASIQPDPVAWEDHVVWLERVLADPTRRLSVAVEDVPVGVVRYDGLDSDRPELSWTVAPDQRGRGVGKRMLMAAVGERPLMARIRGDNLGSQAIARAAGFTMRSQGNVEIWDYQP